MNIDVLKSSSDYELIAADYNRMWYEDESLIRQGNCKFEPLPIEGQARWGISAILRPNESITGFLMSEVANLKVLTGEEHIWYNPDSLHLTIRTIERYREKVLRDDRLVHEYLSRLTEVAKFIPPITLEFSGLTANASGVFVQGWPKGDLLKLLRELFHNALVEMLPKEAPEINNRRRTAHISLGVFGNTPLINPTALASYIGNNRRTYYGAQQFSHIDIVRYHLTKDSVILDRLGVVNLEAI